MSKPVSKSQLVKLLRQAGFPEKDIPTMVGIAGGESSFIPSQHNPNANTGDNSYGLFQINMLGAMGPERRRQFGIESNDQLFDPATNVRAAKNIYDSQGLGAWTVYNNKSYRNFMPTAAQVEPGEPSEIPTVAYPTDYPTGDITVNNYYGPKREELKDPNFTDNLMKTLLINNLGNRQNNGLKTPTIREILLMDSQQGGYLNPMTYMENYGLY